MPCFFVVSSLQIKFSGTRSKLTALDLQCRTTSEVGVVFSQNISEFLGWYDLCVVSLAQPPPYPKFPVRSNWWTAWLILPARFFHVCHWSVGESAFPDVFCHIAAKPHPDRLSIKVNLLFLDFSYQNGERFFWITRPFWFASKCFEPASGFQLHKSNQCWPLPSREFLL